MFKFNWCKNQNLGKGFHFDVKHSFDFGSSLFDLSLGTTTQNNSTGVENHDETINCKLIEDYRRTVDSNIPSS